MDFSENYFQLFGLPQHFLIDGEHLSNHYRKLQKDIHPDNYANESASEQRIAVQFASYVNTAYNTLKSPLLRAEYLLSLLGSSINKDTQTIEDKAFLFKQLEWREQLASIDRDDVNQAFNDIELMSSAVSVESKALYELLVQRLDEKDLAMAEQIVAKLHFIEKLQIELDDLEASFDA